MFRQDWLADVVTVPYVATLGPVHPDAATAELFDAVFRLEPGQFLEWDKERRWSELKDETVSPEDTEHTAERTTIITVSSRRGGTVTLYQYATRVPDLPSILRRVAMLTAERRLRRGRVVWFQRTSPRTAGISWTRTLLAPTHCGRPRPDKPIVSLDLCDPVLRATFRAFSGAVGSGMDHLADRWAAGCVTGPILVAIDAGHIVGAIGPMQTNVGPTGGKQLLPQYFAVQASHQGRGYGRSLWRAAQRWGRDHGARYQLLQVAPGSPADALYRSEGTSVLGITCSVSI